MLEYIESFYNPKRKHARNGMLSHAEFERQQKIPKRVYETRGSSVSCYRTSIRSDSL